MLSALHYPAVHVVVSVGGGAAPMDQLQGGPPTAFDYIEQFCISLLHLNYTGTINALPCCKNQDNGYWEEGEIPWHNFYI